MTRATINAVINTAHPQSAIIDVVVSDSLLYVALGSGFGGSAEGFDEGFTFHGIGSVGQVCLCLGVFGHVGAGVGHCFDFDGDQLFPSAPESRTKNI